MAEATTTKKVTKKVDEVSSEVPKAATKKEAKKALFATLATGGKQYRIKEGDTLKIEKLVGKHEVGDKVVFDTILMTDDGASEITLGTPFVKGASITATLKKIARNKTIDVIKYKQKSRYFKKYGHRQPYFEIQIDSIK